MPLTDGRCRGPGPDVVGHGARIDLQRRGRLRRRWRGAGGIPARSAPRAPVARRRQAVVVRERRSPASPRTVLTGPADLVRDHRGDLGPAAHDLLRAVGGAPRPGGLGRVAGRGTRRARTAAAAAGQRPRDRSAGGTRRAGPGSTTCARGGQRPGGGQPRLRRARRRRSRATARDAATPSSDDRQPPTSQSSGRRQRERIVAAQIHVLRVRQRVAETNKNSRPRTKSVAAATPRTSGGRIGCVRGDPTTARPGRSRRPASSQPKNHPSDGKRDGLPRRRRPAERIQFWSNTTVCAATIESPAPTNSGCVSRVLRYRVKPTAAPASQKRHEEPSFAARPSGDRWACTPIGGEADRATDGNHPRRDRHRGRAVAPWRESRTALARRSRGPAIPGVDLRVAVVLVGERRPHSTSCDERLDRLA